MKVTKDLTNLQTLSNKRPASTVTELLTWLNRQNANDAVSHTFLSQQDTLDPHDGETSYSECVNVETKILGQNEKKRVMNRHFVGKCETRGLF